jgi:hypothetical protein
VYQRLLGTGLPALRVVPIGTPVREPRTASGQRAATATSDYRPLAGVTTPFSVELMFPREVWINRLNGHGVVRTLRPRLWFPTPADHAAWIAAGSPSWTRMHGPRWDTTPPPSWRDPRRIGTYRWRHARRLYDFGYADNRLDDPAAGPAQLTTALRKTRSVPSALGTHLVGSIRDPLGREGVGIRRWYAPNDQYNIDVIDIYDPTTLRMLAIGLIPSHAPLTPDNVLWSTVFTIPSAPARHLTSARRR